MSTIFEWDEKDIENLLATCERDGIFPLVQKYMPKPSRVLESGCGTGRYVKYLHDRGWDVVGLEWAPETIDTVRKHWPEVKVVQGDAADSPFEDNYFDGIISLGVIEHWTDGPSAPLADIYRTLKPGGVAIITAPCLNTVRRIKKAIWWNEFVNNRKETINWLKKRGPKPNRLNKDYIYFPYPTYGDYFEYRFTKKEFFNAVNQQGFEIVEHEPFALIDGFYHELNPGKRLVKFEDWKFEVTPLGNVLNNLLSKKRFFHPHHNLAIVRKPGKPQTKKTKRQVSRKS